jgi:hypothetical protein
MQPTPVVVVMVDILQVAAVMVEMEEIVAQGMEAPAGMEAMVV